VIGPLRAPPLQPLFVTRIVRIQIRIRFGPTLGSAVSSLSTDEPVWSGGGRWLLERTGAV